MNRTAAAEITMKNGRRTASLSSCRRPHAPPRFLAEINERTPSMILTDLPPRGLWLSRFVLTQLFDQRSRTSVTTETVRRKAIDGRGTAGASGATGGFSLAASSGAASGSLSGVWLLPAFGGELESSVIGACSSTTILRLRQRPSAQRG